MDEHVHTGFVAFVSTGVYAVLFIWLMRLLAAKLTSIDATATFGKALGGIVHFA